MFAINPVQFARVSLAITLIYILLESFTKRRRMELLVRLHYKDGETLDPDSLRRCGIYPAFRQAGIPIIPRESGCHAFRHLAGSIINRQTGNLKLAQTQLGHSNVSTTGDIYTHVDEASLKQTAKILGNVLGKTCCRFVVEGTDQVQ